MKLLAVFVVLVYLALGSLGFLVAMQISMALYVLWLLFVAFFFSRWMAEVFWTLWEM